MRRHAIPSMACTTFLIIILDFKLLSWSPQGMLHRIGRQHMTRLTTNRFFDQFDLHLQFCSTGFTLRHLETLFPSPVKSYGASTLPVCLYGADMVLAFPYRTHLGSKSISTNTFGHAGRVSTQGQDGVTVPN